MICQIRQSAQFLNRYTGGCSRKLRRGSEDLGLNDVVLDRVYGNGGYQRFKASLVLGFEVVGTDGLPEDRSQGLFFSGRAAICDILDDRRLAAALKQHLRDAKERTFCRS